MHLRYLAIPVYFQPTLDGSLDFNSVFPYIRSERKIIEKCASEMITQYLSLYLSFMILPSPWSIILPISNIFLDIEIEFKYWTCVTKNRNTTVNFWIKMMNIGTAYLHFGPLKSLSGAKSCPKWSPENQGPTTSSCARRGRRWKEIISICRGNVDPAEDFKLLIYLIYKRTFSLVF